MPNKGDISWAYISWGEDDGMLHMLESCKQNVLMWFMHDKEMNTLQVPFISYTIHNIMLAL
jgi:hypothetical protein